MDMFGITHQWRGHSRSIKSDKIMQPSAVRVLRTGWEYKQEHISRPSQLTVHTTFSENKDDCFIAHI